MTLFMNEREENIAAKTGKVFIGIFLLHHNVLKSLIFPPRSFKDEIMDKTSKYSYLFTTLSQVSTTLKKRAFENIVGKGENAGHQHFLLFSCFLQLSKTKIIIQAKLDLSSANAFNLVKAKILPFGKGIKCEEFPKFHKGYKNRIDPHLLKLLFYP